LREPDVSWGIVLGGAKRKLARGLHQGATRLTTGKDLFFLNSRFSLIASSVVLGLAYGCGMDSSPDNAGLSGDDGRGSGGSGAGLATGGTAGTGGLPPETETEETYTAPVVSGRWIWTANPVSGRVALIDSESLRVRTTEAGLAPTYLAALPSEDADSSAAVVINVGSYDATVLRAENDAIESFSLPLHIGANRLSVSPSGRYVIVWTDAALEQNADATEGFQDITVLDLGGPEASSRRLTVGYRPSRVFVATGEGEAFVVAESGVSVISLGDSDRAEVLRDVPITTNPTESASARDVTVTPDGSFAFVRREGSARIDMISLSDGSMRSVTLRAPVTDLDLSPDGTRAFAVVRGAPVTVPPDDGAAGEQGGGAGQAQAGFGGEGFGGEGFGGEGFGGAGGEGLGAAGEEAAVVAGASNGGQGASSNVAGESGVSGGETSSGGDGAVSTGGAAGEGVGGDGAAGGSAAGGAAAGGSGGTGPMVPTGEISEVAMLSLPEIFDDPTAFESTSIPGVFGSITVAEAGDVALLYTNAVPSDRVTILYTGGSAALTYRTVVVNAPVRAVLPTPDGAHAVALLGQAEGSQHPGNFSLIPIAERLPPKLVAADAPPASVAVGSNEALITTSGAVHDVFLARFPELSTVKTRLASKPLSAALIPDASKGFVAQAHPEGRITFLDLESGAPRTITGFELASKVVTE
jgi:hypothetical protein